MTGWREEGRRSALSRVLIDNSKPPRLYAPKLICCILARPLKLRQRLSLIAMDILIAGLVLVLVLAYANGANDVSKGVATLVGSGVTSYHTAILWGTIWTMLGAVTAASWATAMLKTFTTGILKGQIAFSGQLGFAIVTAAILWVLFASWRGLPVSTTHAILGGLCGSAVVMLGVDGVEWATVIKKAALPLVLSPVVAFVVTWSLLPLLQATVGRWSGYCLCLQPRSGALVTVNPQGQARILYQTRGPDVVVDSPTACEQVRLSGLTVGIDSIHWLSSGTASFARGLNDAPKIVSLILIMQISGKIVSGILLVGFVLTAISMGLGSYFGGRRVTEVLAEKITCMSHTEGLAANLTTSALVTATAILGMPVSTTHVSSSAIIAMGVRNGVTAVRWATVKDMILAWVVTLPVAALLGGVLALMARLIL
jgi:PiT family inorganic phosphate transporter